MRNVILVGTDYRYQCGPRRSACETRGSPGSVANNDVLRSNTRSAAIAEEMSL